MQAFYEAVKLDDVPAIRIGPGCTRRDLPGPAGARFWVVDIEPGHQWPSVDHHDHHGEQVLVVSGELIEGDQRFAPGTYLNYAPHQGHQPRTETGVRLFGINLAS